MLSNGFPFRQRGSAALLLAMLSLAAPVVLKGKLEVPEDGELLLPGTSRERAITAGEKHVYRVAVADVPLLVTVEQLGIDLVIEAQRPTARLMADAGELRWGPEVLLIESTGGHRVEVHPRGQSPGPGRYTIRVETVPEDGP